MTCLVGTFDGVWADRRVTGGNGSVYLPSRKVVRGDGIVAAFCGDSGACVKAMQAVRAGETDVQALAALCDGIVVTERARWSLGDGMAIRIPARVPFATDGSGHAEAAAFLTGAAAYDSATIRAAFRYVARVRSDCGDGVDELLLRR